MSRGPWAVRGVLVPAGWLGLLALAGCNGFAGFEGPDPLVGGSVPVRRAAPAAGTAAAGAPAGSLPPLPAPSSTTALAGLASGVDQRLPADDSRNLRLEGGAAAGERPLWGNPAASAGVTLQGVQPVGGGAAAAPTAGGPAAFTLTGGAAARVFSYEQGQQLLRARGVTWQRLETSGEDGEWHFWCSIPNPQNPGVHRTYEARARGELPAMQAVLDQIDAQNR
jgi:hypothetical protein